MSENPFFTFLPLGVCCSSSQDCEHIHRRNGERGQQCQSHVSGHRKTGAQHYMEISLRQRWVIYVFSFSSRARSSPGVLSIISVFALIVLNVKNHSKTYKPTLLISDVERVLCDELLMMRPWLSPMVTEAWPSSVEEMKRMSSYQPDVCGLVWMRYVLFAVFSSLRWANTPNALWQQCHAVFISTLLEVDQILTEQDGNK